jgi:hypothetical protein
MTTTAISQLLYLLEESFQSKDWESLLANLESVTPEDWLWVAPGGRRSIRDIVAHLGSCKFMYHNQAFGDAKLTWDDPLLVNREALATIPTAIEWLRQGHERLVQSISALNDDDLLCLRPHHSGKLKEIRWIILAMISHDLYHAGEINYIRSLHQQNDE